MMWATKLNKLLRPNRAYRVIAIFFLVFTVIDLACPWLCQEDWAACTGVGHVQQKLEADTRAGLRGKEQRPDHDSKSGAFEEDCFCCCSHVQPSYWPIVPATNFDHWGFPLPPSGLPIPPPLGTYRPPRSAYC